MTAPTFTDHIQELHLRFSADLNGDGAGTVQEQRVSGLHRFLESGLPTTEAEDWKYTSLRTLANLPLALAPVVTADPTLFSEQPWYPLLTEEAIRLVFINGFYAPTLSFNADPRYASGSLAEFLRSNTEDVLAHLGRAADTTRSPFPSLNTAFLRDGVFVSLPAGAEAALPIHAVFITITDDTPIMTSPRVLIVAGANSKATIVETHVGIGEGPAFTNAVTEILASEGAHIEHFKYQDENVHTIHLAAVQCVAERDAVISSSQFTFGAALSRTDIGARLAGPGAECTINGLTMVDGAQHSDVTTILDHASPHCVSHELLKSIVDGSARTAFTGKIIVRPGAQKTDAKQSNNNLLLSEDASADSRPQLEIFADDVKCTHGATVGRLDETMLFYLRSRGISRHHAFTMLVFAFAGELVQRITPDFLRTTIDQRIHTRFPSVTDL